MKRFVVYIQEHSEISVKVEADDLEGAIEAAYDSDIHGVCAQCSGWGKEWNRDVEIGDPRPYYEVDGEWVDGDE